MNVKIHKIDIIPGRFLRKEGDKYAIRCYLHEGLYQDRLFDSYSLEGIINPDLVFIGIMTGVGMMQINFCSANEFRKYFETKWKNIL